MNGGLTSAVECFALLDDAGATTASPVSRLYTGHVGTLICRHAADMPAWLAELDSSLARGWHAVALWSYELGADLQGIAPRESDALAVSHILLFERMQHMSSAEVDAWLALRQRREDGGDPASVAGVLDVTPSMEEPAFIDAVRSIRQYIAAGDTYQVNFTYRLRFSAYGSTTALYRRLRQRQPVPFGALIALPSGATVLSLSPELFVRHERGTLTARPMKGTAIAADDAADNAARAASLAADEKNRAENLMIVDLLRNDLGRIAASGSVHVPALFDVTRFGDVLQMTSTVTATRRDDVSLTDIVTAIYPCGSITGAPKRRTMEIVRELEDTPRGWYTGAIGWFAPYTDGGSVGDFCLSVPIRTLVLDPPDAVGFRAGEMGVGAGIVHDSVARDEYAECRLKAGFLTGLPPQFGLFETMRATRADGCPLKDLHLRRMAASARSLGLEWNGAAAESTLARALAKLEGNDVWRVRLALDAHDGFTVTAAPLAPLPQTVKVGLSTVSMQSVDGLLRHKTTRRALYDAAWRAAERQGGFDLLFVNERGELTEGGRSNLFLKCGGRWMTPPVSAGLLPGVMRAVLLADPTWQAVECTLTLQDLQSAEEIVVCNALRGAMPAVLDGTLRDD